MPRKTPSWWSDGGGWPALALSPVAAAYGAAVKARFARTIPYRAKIPVICVGNFTMGGAGKTPLAIALAKLLMANGENPAFLTRGYGGRETGPVWVDPARHRALDVGDEPLLLARHARVMVARVRPDGARRIEESRASVIIMDDGFQNPSLHKDMSVIAVDGGFGLGNGRVFPAGPLRAPLGFQIARADAIVVVGGAWTPPVYGSEARPIFNAHIRPSNAAWLNGARVVAFCGIGRPEKFFDTLRSAGADLAETVAFADHHVFTSADAMRLLESARRMNATLVTTEKDWVRIAPHDAGAVGDLRHAVKTLPIELSFDKTDDEDLFRLITSHLRRA